jgi:signal transduction histidine kinase
MAQSAQTLSAPGAPPPSPPQPGPATAAPRRVWMKLPQKTTVILLTVMVAVVTVVGGIFFFSTRSMLQTSQAAQVSAFAYGLSATLGDMESPNRSMVQIAFNALDKTPNLEFVILTDARGNRVAGFVSDEDAWDAFRRPFHSAGQTSSRLGQVQEVSRGLGGANSYAITVPVFQVEATGPSHLYGYLHASFGSQGTAAQLRFLQALVLFTCMGVVLLAVPVASLIARNIAIPIQRLAAAAHALADGDLTHRVALTRRDELGELADAFNRMADTVQQQQADIRRINAGLEQKVHERTAELEKLNRRLQAEIAEKEDFLRAVSHDLNAPLRNIAGMASMLALKYQHTLEKDALQRLDRIQKNVQVECELINELLELSRIKTRREKVERVDLHELVTAVADGFSNDLETRGITLKLLSHLPVMRCEKARMRQVFQNLIDNGIKYMRPEEAGGPREIRVAVRPQDGEVVISVADTGMGISADDLPHLFHVFRRAKNATVMKVPGKGVGLASVKSIIENYHGRLWAESVEGQGTTFHVALPAAHFETPQEVPA